MHSYCSSVDGGIGTVLKVTRIYSDGGVTLAVVWYVVVVVVVIVVAVSDTYCGV